MRILTHALRGGGRVLWEGGKCDRQQLQQGAAAEIALFIPPPCLVLGSLLVNSGHREAWPGGTQGGAAMLGLRCYCPTLGCAASQEWLCMNCIWVPLLFLLSCILSVRTLGAVKLPLSCRQGRLAVAAIHLSWLVDSHKTISSNNTIAKIWHEKRNSGYGSFTSFYLYNSLVRKVRVTGRAQS